MKLIPYGKQHIDNKDIASVAKTLKKEKITTGDEVEKFEKEVSNYLKCKYSATCNSGTSALFLAMRSANIKKNDTIIMPSINFISSYNVAKLFGAKIYLADVDKVTGQMRPMDVLNCFNKFKLRKVKAIIVMYNGGYPQNAEKFFDLKRRFNFIIIEDACHALGAKYIIKKNAYRVGCCKHSDISTFSLHPLKTITTGEGGLVTTNSRKIDQRIKKLRSLGLKKFKGKHWIYDVVFQGFNFRLNDFQCALGISQLKKINKFLEKRSKIAKIYNEELKKNSHILTPNHLKNYLSSNHLYIINIKKGSLKIKENLIKYMLKNKIILQYHYIPIYKFKIFKDKYIGKNAELFYKTAVSLPIYFDLKKKDQRNIIKKINNFFKIC